MTFRLPKVSQREWLFLIGGAVLGYVVVPRILHQSGFGTPNAPNPTKNYSTDGCGQDNCTVPGYPKCGLCLNDDGAGGTVCGGC